MTASSVDQEHLRLLAIFHYIVGALTAALACIPLIHLAVGVAIILSPDSFQHETADQTPIFVGWLFAALGAFFFLCGQALAICMILSGRFLKRRVHHTFVFVTACIECMVIPFGTILGVFTIIVLSRDSVRMLFDLPSGDAELAGR